MTVGYEAGRSRTVDHRPRNISACLGLGLHQLRRNPARSSNPWKRQALYGLASTPPGQAEPRLRPGLGWRPAPAAASRSCARRRDNTCALRGPYLLAPSGVTVRMLSNHGHVVWVASSEGKLQLLSCRGPHFWCLIICCPSPLNRGTIAVDIGGQCSQLLESFVCSWSE